MATKISQLLDTTSPTYLSETLFVESGVTYKATLQNLIPGLDTTATGTVITVTDSAVTITPNTTFSGGLATGGLTRTSYNAAAYDVVLGSAGNGGMTIVSGTANIGSIHFADGTTGDQAYRGLIKYDHATDAMVVGVAGGTTALTISSALNTTFSGYVDVPTGYAFRFGDGGERIIGTNATSTITIRTADTAAITIDGSQNTTFGGTTSAKGLCTITSATTESAALDIGSGRTGNGYAWIDLIGDATYTDYGLRLVRLNTGANAASQIVHRGTGALQLYTTENANIDLYTAGVLALTLSGADQSATFGGNISLADGKSLYLGSGSDALLQYSGTTFYLQNTSGIMSIEQQSPGDLIYIYTDDSGGTARIAATFGGATPAFEAYYNSSLRSFTTSSGFQVVNSGDTVMLDLGRTQNHGSSQWVGQLRFYGQDSAAASEQYAYIGTYVTDNTAGSEDGELYFGTVRAGTITYRAWIGSGLVMVGAASGDMGAGTINATGLYVNGTAVSSFSGELSGSGVQIFSTYRTDAHGSGAYIGHNYYYGTDSSSNKQLFAYTSAYVVDNTNGSEDSKYEIWTYSAGTAYLTASHASTSTNGAHRLYSSGTSANLYLQSSVTSGSAGILYFTGKDSIASDTNYAWITANISNSTNGVETGELQFSTIQSGSSSVKFYVGLGIVVGSATGGDKGLGTINTSGDIYKNNSAYTNPDYAFEHYFTGKIVKFKDNEGARTYGGLMPLNELKDYTSKHYRFPGITDSPTGMFKRSDILLEKLEESYLYIFELHERIETLEAMLCP